MQIVRQYSYEVDIEKCVTMEPNSLKTFSSTSGVLYGLSDSH